MYQFTVVFGFHHLKTYSSRIHEFLDKNYFVFGNGGIKNYNKHVSVDDVEWNYVAVFGHYPCSNYDCYSCRVLHRYTECQYGRVK